ncbi:hypothetical protein TNCT_449291 [Trichonephila clavata]|uniref:Methyltransferase domain-containing protein n=1 Tax=Trichonephila clavata TaxID=2740835 RepID=A0A8X6I0H4_TRICU|nr:hypothetical protein TNCT_449291 [Trichonephila clavata]
MNLLMDSSRLAVHVTDLDTFYDEATEVFKWGSLENSTVMDIGCGLGLSTTKLLKLFPGIKKIVAIDKDIDAVLEARELFPDDKIEFHYGNAELGDGLRQYKNKINAIFSTHCLCYIENQKAAFQNIYDLLEEGGRAALLFFNKSLKKNFFKKLSTDLDIPMFLDIKEEYPEFSGKSITPRQYEDILRKIGFRIERCEEVVQCREYASVEQYKERIMSTIHFPADEKSSVWKSLKNNILDLYMTYYSEISDRNLPCFKDVYLQVFISKPPKCDVYKLDFGNRLSLDEQNGKDETPNQNNFEEEQSSSEDENMRNSFLDYYKWVGCLW